MTVHDDAKPRLTVVSYQEQTSNAVIATAIEALPAKILQFGPRCEQCRKDMKSCQCDAFVGCCDGCGTVVYGGDEPRIDAQGITCPECVAAERTWKVVIPAVAAVAA